MRTRILILAGFCICLALVWAIRAGTQTEPPVRVVLNGYTNLNGIHFAQFSWSNHHSVTMSYTIIAEQRADGIWTNRSGVLQYDHTVAPGQNFAFLWPMDWENGRWRLQVTYTLDDTRIRKLMQRAYEKSGLGPRKATSFLYRRKIYYVLGPEMLSDGEHKLGKS